MHAVEQLQDSRFADAIVPHFSVNPRSRRIDEDAIAPGFLANFRRSNPVYLVFAFTNNKHRRMAKQQSGFPVPVKFSRSGKVGQIMSASGLQEPKQKHG